MIRPQHLIHLALIAALLLAGPAALADPGNGSGRDKCAEGSEGNSGNAHGHRCDTDAAASSEEEEPSTSGEDNSSRNDSPDDNASEPSGRNDENDEADDGAAPEPSPSSPAPAGGDLSLNASVDRSIAQVGDTLTYSITITNTGTGAISPTVTNQMPTEVDFLDASGTPTPTVTTDSLTWTLPPLPPGGSITFSWRGRVAAPGDLDATNTVSALGAAPVETHTYLAEVKGVVLNRSPGEPDWGTHEERKVVFTREERDASVLSDGSTASSSGVLPFTGAPVIAFVAAAALLLAAGFMLASEKRRRLAATTLLVVLVATACTSDAPPQQDRSAPTDAGQDDEVLGTRVGRGNGDGSDQGAADPSDEGSGGSGNGSATDEVRDGDDPVAVPDSPTGTGGVDLGTEPEEVLTREVVLVEVPNDPPPVTDLPASTGDNEIDLRWSAASGSIVAATSRAIFRADSPIQFLTSLDDAGGSLAARITMTNVTEDSRLGVHGRLVLVVSGPEGSIELSSPALQQTLEPGDEVAADFELALPSGDYAVECAYIAS